jgi:hypothetical protein
MTKTRIKNCWRTIETYEVTGITTEARDEIFAFCGGTFFGGTVRMLGNGMARVEVYTD